jgi:hypothetical protein
MNVRSANIDVWGNALAGATGFATPEQSVSIFTFFERYESNIFFEGQVREIPDWQQWEAARFVSGDWPPLILPSSSASAMATAPVYQNGGYWATPHNTLLPFLAAHDREMACRLLHATIASFRSKGVWEWSGPFYPAKSFGAPGYTASAANTYAASKLIGSCDQATRIRRTPVNAPESDTTPLECSAPVDRPAANAGLNAALTCAVAATGPAGATGALRATVQPTALLPGAYADVRAVQYLPDWSGPGRRAVRVASISTDPPSSAVDILSATVAQLHAVGRSGVDLVALKEEHFGGKPATLEESECMAAVAPVAAEHGFYVVCPFKQRLGARPPPPPPRDSDPRKLFLGPKKYSLLVNPYGEHVLGPDNIFRGAGG